MLSCIHLASPSCEYRFADQKLECSYWLEHVNGHTWQETSQIVERTSETRAFASIEIRSHSVLLSWLGCALLREIANLFHRAWLAQSEPGPYLLPPRLQSK